MNDRGNDDDDRGNQDLRTTVATTTFDDCGNDTFNDCGNEDERPQHLAAATRDNSQRLRFRRSRSASSRRSRTVASGSVLLCSACPWHGMAWQSIAIAMVIGMAWHGMATDRYRNGHWHGIDRYRNRDRHGMAVTMTKMGM